MTSLPKSAPAVHPDYPSHDHEGTLIDYRDDPTAWLDEPEYERKVPLPAFPLPVDDDDSFLDEDTDFRQAIPHYDVVFSRPLPPGAVVELTVLDGGSPTTIGFFNSLAEANDAAYRVGTGMFGLKAI